jgi:hypothetical protein
MFLPLSSLGNKKKPEGRVPGEKRIFRGFMDASFLIIFIKVISLSLETVL